MYRGVRGCEEVIDKGSFLPHKSKEGFYAGSYR